VRTVNPVPDRVLGPALGLPVLLGLLARLQLLDGQAFVSGLANTRRSRVFGDLGLVEQALPVMARAFFSPRQGRGQSLPIAFALEALGGDFWSDAAAQRLVSRCRAWRACSATESSCRCSSSARRRVATASPKAFSASSSALRRRLSKTDKLDAMGGRVTLRLETGELTVWAMVAQVPARKYRIERYLAEGGMGAIYVGKKIGAGGFEKEVVLKQLLPEFTSRPEFRDLFFREAKISATLDHQNIVRTFDLVTSEDRLFIVMEYVRGADLRSISWRARRKRPLSAQAILHVALEILAGLAYAHRRRSPSGEPLGIIHRDLSPSNILCSPKAR